MSKDFKNLHLFDLENHDEMNIDFKNKNIKNYRVKTIKSGDVLECEIYPVWNTNSTNYRNNTKKPSRKVQADLNDKNRKKHVARLLNTNFKKNDYWVTFGYDENNLPENSKQAQRDVVNFIKRLKNLRKKMGLPSLKYFYVVEFTDANEKKVRPHVHIVMLGDMDRNLIESVWKKGQRNSIRKISPDENGITGIAKYITKTKPEHRRWGSSLNLKKPNTTYADNKITKRKVEYIAKNQNDVKEIFEKIYAGYIYNDMEKPKTSSYVSGTYLYVRMRKIDMVC